MEKDGFFEVSSPIFAKPTPKRWGEPNETYVAPLALVRLMMNNLLDYARLGLAALPVTGTVGTGRPDSSR